MEKENKEQELNQVKKEYHKYIKIIKIVLFTILAIAIIFMAIFICRFYIFYKILKTNISLYLGDNYKVYIYDDTTNSLVSSIFYKNNIKKYILGDGTDGYINYATPEALYVVYPDKRYFRQDSYLGTLLSNRKINLYDGEASLDEKACQISILTRSIKNAVNFKIEIDKEVYKDTEYIIFDSLYNKFYIDKNSKIIKYRCDGNIIYRFEIEQNTVTDEEIALPNLNDYQKIEDSK